MELATFDNRPEARVFLKSLNQDIAITGPFNGWNDSNPKEVIEYLNTVKRLFDRKIIFKLGEVKDNKLTMYID